MDLNPWPSLARPRAGRCSIGIRQGTEAWLDDSTGYGHVRNTMEAFEGPKAVRGSRRRACPHSLRLRRHQPFPLATKDADRLKTSTTTIGD